MMSNDDITLLTLTWNDRYLGRLYYYQGNFFMPLELPGPLLGYVRDAILRFMKENAELVKRDRAHLDYRTILQLAGFA